MGILDVAQFAQTLVEAVRFPEQGQAREFPHPTSEETVSALQQADGGGEIGLISSVSQPFCATCTRARLSSEGSLYTCLFAAGGFDLRALLRGGQSDEDIGDAIRRAWKVRADRYSELRTAATVTLPKVEMSHIGG